MGSPSTGWGFEWEGLFGLAQRATNGRELHGYCDLSALTMV